jgi:isoleucyl-tRNA synthetase
MQAKSRAYATEQINQQREDFKRLGVLGDWERPYRTMDPPTKPDRSAPSNASSNAALSTAA